MIRTWRPWEKSTGPKTTEGKGTVSRNYLKSRRSRMQQWMPAFQLAALQGDPAVMLTLVDLFADADRPLKQSKRSADF